MDLESWQTASGDVKQSIIARADPPTVRNFCQADRNSREICRDRLPAVVKYRSCLDSSESAQECDKISMFSRPQFLNVVPPQISIIPDDELQLTHEFYSQKYKLKTEGFSEALYKAKIINTICAIIRPHILRTYRDKMGAIPPYVSAEMIDIGISIYDKSVEISRTNPIATALRITITAIRKDEMGIDNLSMTVADSHSYKTIHFLFVIIAKRENYQDLTSIHDSFVNKIFIATTASQGIMKYRIAYESLNRQTLIPNAFIVSRILYDMINRGFGGWTIEYNQDDLITGDDYIKIDYKL